MGRTIDLAHVFVKRSLDWPFRKALGHSCDQMLLGLPSLIGFQLGHY